MDLHWILPLALAFGLWGFRKRREERSEPPPLTLRDLAAMLVGWAIEWSKKNYEDILEIVQHSQASRSENRKRALPQELLFAAVSATRTPCEIKVEEALGPDGLQAFEAALPMAARLFLREDHLTEGEIRDHLAQLEAAHAEYRGVIFAPEVSSMPDLGRRLYTVFSQRVFGTLVEDPFLATAFFTYYMSCARGFEEVLKPSRIIRG